MRNPPPGTTHVLEALFIPRFSGVGRSRGDSSSIKERDRISARLTGEGQLFFKVRRERRGESTMAGPRGDLIGWSLAVMVLLALCVSSVVAAPSAATVGVRHNMRAAIISQMAPDLFR